MSKITVIIPCYNEGKRLPQKEFIKGFENNPSITFLFVNDGSQDNTLQIIQGFEKRFGNVVVLNQESNSGKATSVRFAMLYALEHIDFEYIAYFDADLATSLDELSQFYLIFEQKPLLSLVVGSRVRRMGAYIDRTWRRHIIGRVFATFASLTLLLPIYDTQCGAKMMKKDVANQLFKDKFISKWLFDIEIFARLTLLVGYPEIKDAIYEYPLNSWKEVGDSRIKLKDFLRFPIDLLKIYRKYYRMLKKQKKTANTK